MINIVNEILNKVLAIQIQKYIKKDHIPRSSGVYPRILYNIHKSINNIPHKKEGSYHRKDKNHRIISIDAEKSCDKIQHPFMIKTLSKAGIEGAHLNIIKAIDKKPTANITLKRQKLKLSP